MALNTIPGSPDADSYVKLADTVAHFLARRNTAAWDALAAGTEQETAIQDATRSIDRFFLQHIANEGVTGNRVVPNQALVWPWWCSEWVIRITAESGTTTTITDDYLENSDWPDDFFNSGSAWIHDASSVAPEFELQAVSDFVRSTGVLTTAAFSVAVPSGATVYLTTDAPVWLKIAVYEQIIWELEDKHLATGDNIQAGVISTSKMEGGSASYDATAPATWLASAAYQSIRPHLPQGLRLENG